MKVYVLADWEAEQIIGVYIDKHEADSDRQRFIDYEKLEVIARDLIE